MRSGFKYLKSPPGALTHSVGPSVLPAHQGGGFHPQSGHIRDSANGSANDGNHGLMFRAPSLALPLPLSNRSVKNVKSTLWETRLALRSAGTAGRSQHPGGARGKAGCSQPAPPKLAAVQREAGFQSLEVSERRQAARWAGSPLQAAPAPGGGSAQNGLRSENGHSGARDTQCGVTPGYPTGSAGLLGPGPREPPRCRRARRPLPRGREAGAEGRAPALCGPAVTGRAVRARPGGGVLPGGRRKHRSRVQSRLLPYFRKGRANAAGRGLGRAEQASDPRAGAAT